MTKQKRADLQARIDQLEDEVEDLTERGSGAWEDGFHAGRKWERDRQPLRAVLARDARRLWDTAADAAVARLPRWIGGQW